MVNIFGKKSESFDLKQYSCQDINEMFQVTSCSLFCTLITFLSFQPKFLPLIQSAGVVEYTDCITAEG